MSVIFNPTGVTGGIISFLVTAGLSFVGIDPSTAAGIGGVLNAGVGGFSYDKSTEERVRDTMRKALDAAFDDSAKRQDAPCVFSSSIRRAVRDGLKGDVAVRVSPGGVDGAAALRDLILDVCKQHGFGVSEEALQWVVNDFFEQLKWKMLSDEKLSARLMYEVACYGFSAIVGQLNGVDARLNNLEDAQKEVLSAFGPNGAVAALLRGLEYRSDEEIPLVKDGAEGERKDGWFWDALRMVNEEVMAKTGEARVAETPRGMTAIRQSSLLVGRASEVEAVNALLASNSIVVVRADGGVGKTSLAVALTNGHYRRNGTVGEGDYLHFAWLKSTGDLRSDLALVTTSGTHQQLTRDEHVEAVLSWLSHTSEKTLLSIDGMDAPPSGEDRDILDRISPDVRVLVTSRGDLGLGKVYELKPLDADQARRMFYAYFLETNEAPSMDDLKARRDYSTAGEIVERCQGNALLIELVAKAACSEGGFLQDYWERCGSEVFKDESASLETEHLRERGDGPDTLREQVSRLYALSGLTEQQERAMALLVQFPPDTPIYYKLRDWAGISRDDMNRLVKLGWVERREGSYSIHQVVRESVLLQLEASGTTVNPMDYGDLISKALDEDDYLSEGEGHEVISERIVIPWTLENLLREMGGIDATEMRAPLCLELGTVLFQQGDYKGASTYGHRALAIVKFLLKEGKPDSMGIYRIHELKAHLIIADCFTGIGHFDIAEAHLNEVLRVVGHASGSDSPEAAMIGAGLAEAHSLRGDYESALKRLEKSVESLKTGLGVNHFMTALVEEALGRNLLAIGDYESARKHLESAAGPIESALGADAPKTRDAYANLGAACLMLGDNMAALTHFMKAEDGLKETPDDDDPDTSSDYHNLGATFAEVHNFELARKCLRRSARGYELTLGAENFVTAKTYADLGRICMGLEDYEEARGHFERAVDPIEAELGAYDLETCKVHTDLGMACTCLGDYEEARKHLESAADSYEAICGASSPEAAWARAALGTTYIESDKRRAWNYLNGAAGVIEAAFGADDPKTRSVYLNLGTVSFMLGKFKQALSCMEKARR